MKKRKNIMSKGLTLIELLVALVIMAILLSTAVYFYTLQLNQIITDMHLADVYAQVDYALENIRLRCLSSIQINSSYLFAPGYNNSKNSFCFAGESNVYNITPDNLADNTNYCYYINPAGELVLSANTKPEVLIDSQYRPAINFTYNAGSEPNLLTANIVAKYKNITVAKFAALRFWFIDVVSP